MWALTFGFFDFANRVFQVFRDTRCAHLGACLRSADCLGFVAARLWERVGLSRILPVRGMDLSSACASRCGWNLREVGIASLCFQCDAIVRGSAWGFRVSESTRVRRSMSARLRGLPKPCGNFWQT